MRKLIRLGCCIFVFIIFCSPASYGDFSFDVNSFTVVSGASTFVDEFDDDAEPPSGPSGPSTYSVSFGAFSTDAESGGVLNMNSNDAGVLGGDEIAIAVSLADNTYYFTPGSGGYVVVKFSFPGGIANNTFFDFDLSSQPWEPDNPNEAVELSFGKGPSGRVTAFFAAYVDDGLDEVDVDISDQDITGLLGTSTDITMRLDVSTADVVTASLDIGSDGLFDVIMPGSHTLTFPGGKPYGSGFGPGEDALQCGIDMNQAIYTPGDTVTAQVFRIANLGSGPVPVEWKVWLGTPFRAPISIINIGADGTFVLPAGFDYDFGPLNLFSAASLPAGFYELSTRVLDPITGETLCEDLNVFEIQ
jgi:hypothetical protein